MKVGGYASLGDKRVAKTEETSVRADRRRKHRGMSVPKLKQRVLLLVSFAAALTVSTAITGTIAYASQADVYMLLSRLLMASLILFLFGGILHVWSLARRHLNELQDALDQLREARAAADAASKAKSRFLATVSHELRTPLNGVLGMTGLLLDTRLTSEQTTYAEAVDTSARSLLSIIDELLDAARVDAGELKIEATGLNLVDAVESVVELLAPRAHAKNIEVGCFISPALPKKVIGDPKRLRQVLLNIVGNAIKFTSRGGVLITVEPGQGHNVLFSVRDTGHGIPRDELDAVFDRFVQSSIAESQATGGTGLGLSISRNLVQLMGGDISVESEVGQGSTFSFILPMEPAEQVTAQSGDEVRSFAGAVCHVAIAGGATRDAIARYLSSYGATVHLHDSTDCPGLKALPAAGPASARVMVLIEPGSGEGAEELHRSARLLERVGEVWVLLRPEERRVYRQVMEDPGIGYLVKPVRNATLVQQVGRNPGEAKQPADELRRTARRMRRSKPGAGLQIMLVEDNRINQMLAEKILGAAGHDVIHFADGESAVLEVEQQITALGGAGYDVILMDIQMPGIDGLEATRLIRELEARAEAKGPVPILALSANARRDDQMASIAAGMNGYLAKPFDRADLEQAIASLALDGHAA